MFVTACLRVDTVDTCKSVSVMYAVTEKALFSVFCMKVHEHG